MEIIEGELLSCGLRAGGWAQWFSCFTRCACRVRGLCIAAAAAIIVCYSRRRRIFADMPAHRPAFPVLTCASITLTAGGCSCCWLRC